MESNSVKVRYFPLKEDYAYAQLTTQMTEKAYNTLTGTTPQERETKKSSTGRAMILCLDKSGSMSGAPFSALRQGASLVGKNIFESRGFEEFVTLFYDTGVHVLQESTADAYEKKLNTYNASGSTNFLAAFTSIMG